MNLERDQPDALLAAGLHAEAQRNLPRAVARLQRLTAVSPRSATAHFHLGRLLSGQRRNDNAAIRALQTAKELEPDSVWGLQAEQMLKAIMRR
jgi:tetratricopeptide (TPR) repeat protein